MKKKEKTFFREQLRLVTKTMKLIWQMAPISVSQISILTFIDSLLPAASIWISKMIFDLVAQFIKTGGDTSILAPLFLWVGLELCLKIISTGIGSFNTLISDNFAEYFSKEIQDIILIKTASLNIAFFENPTFYNKLELTKQGAMNQPIIVFNNISQLISNIITFGSVLFIIAHLHILMIPVILIITFPILLFETKFGNKRFQLTREQMPERRLSLYIFSLLSVDKFAKEWKFFGISSYLLKKNRLLMEKFYLQSGKLRKDKALPGFLLSITSIICYYGFIGFIIFNIVRNKMTIGDFSLYTRAFVQSQDSSIKIYRNISTFYEKNLYLSYLFDYLEMPATLEGNISPIQKTSNLIDKKISKRKIELLDNIELRNVSFKYPLTEKQILKNVNLQIKKGEKIGLVGKNGSGKTTLIKLICGLYQPTEGQILVNGIDLNQYDLDSYWQRLSVIFQDYVHYNLTAKENIGFGNVSKIDDITGIRNAARKTGIDEFIDSLEHKYDNYLGRVFMDGQQLSGGEWQKVALSRAYFRDADLNIMDEPTAFLDPYAEFQVFRDFYKTQREKTAIVISHRFSNVKMADAIYVMEQGAIIESGTHNRLMADRGTYYNLFNQQVSSYTLEER